MTEGMMAYEALEYLHQILALVEHMAGFGDHIVGDPATYARITAPPFRVAPMRAACPVKSAGNRTERRGWSTPATAEIRVSLPRGRSLPVRSGCGDAYHCRA